MKFAESMLRLYAVTDRSWLGNQTLVQQVEQALKGGVTCVQLREKTLDPELFTSEAREMKILCSRYGVPLIINDNVDLALEVDADGVHIGQGDMDAHTARRLIGTNKILGVTAKTIEQARLAQEAGADYLGSGAVFGSSTKPDAKAMSLELLRSICSSVAIPVVAIGGIHRGNIDMLRGSGIHGAAIVSGIFSAPDIEKECSLLKEKMKIIVP